MLAACSSSSSSTAAAAGGGSTPSSASGGGASASGGSSGGVDTAALTTAQAVPSFSQFADAFLRYQHGRRLYSQDPDPVTFMGEKATPLLRGD